MHEQVAIARAENEACPKLERILPESMLPEPVSHCTCAGFNVLAEENVEQVSGFQFRGLMRGPL